MIFHRLRDLWQELRLGAAARAQHIRQARSGALGLVVAAGVLVASPLTAHAGGGAGGGAIGWANAVNQFSTEGVAVGAAAVVLGIIAVGAILMFGITGLITTVVMVCLGGALMANAQNIGGTLFAAGGGGGSIRDAGPAAGPGPAAGVVVAPAAPGAAAG